MSIKHYISVLCCVITTLLIGFFDSPSLNIATMWINCMFIIMLSEFDIVHPMFWFTLSFTLYSTAYSILYCLNLVPYAFSKEVILLPSVALLVIVTLVGFKKEERLCINSECVEVIPDVFLRNFIKVLGAILLVCLIHFYTSGYSGKAEMQLNNDIFYRVGMYMIRFFTFMIIPFSICLFYNGVSKKTLTYKLLLYSILPLFFSLLTGERDAFFRYLLIMLLILFYLRIINRKIILTLIPVIIFIMISSVKLKYYFLTGNIGLVDNGISYISQFLTTDFHSAGRNLQYLLINDWTEGHQGYKLLVSEILFPFVPSGTFISPDSWFNNYVHTGAFKGYAFTLVGTGYIIDGIYGVICIFVIVGLVVKILYYMSNKSIYCLSIYLYMISTIVFSFRESLSTILVALFRICIISVIVLKMAERKKIKI